MKKALSLVLILLHTVLFAQTANESLKQGNKLYEQKNYDEAEINYRKALEAEKKDPIRAEFNLGDALYKQERYEEATNQFAKVATQAQASDLKAKAYHNLGNSYTKQEKYKEAIEAYKNSLKLNPKDEETRYNLAKSLKKLAQQQQQQQQQQQEKEGDNKDKDKNEEEKNAEDNKDGDKKPEENKGDDDKPKDKDGNSPDEQGGSEEDPNKKPKPKPGEISRDDAERLLDVLNKEEQQVQKKLNEKKIKGQPINTEKDW